MAETSQIPIVGSRCQCEGFFGTVRFVGEVPPSQGTWVGVEWDDPTRGKHSGEHENIQYFTCREPNSGSFVRPKKLFYGYTFAQALKRRYGTRFREEDYSEEELRISTGKKVEFVGTDMLLQKQSRYEDHTDVGLEGLQLCSAGPDGEIQTISPNITALNIADNPLLNSWEQVACITRQLNHLRDLNVSENHLAVPGDMTVLRPAFTLVSVLSLNKMNLQWKEVLCVVSVMPQLVELHVCKNKISTLQCSSFVGSVLPAGLQLLNLEENLLSEWTDILLLGQMTRLKRLILNDNRISQLFFPDTNVFPVLEALSLDRNQIQQWSSVDAICSLSALRKLRITGNPVLDAEGAFASRQLVIARVSGITDLNSSSITKQERMYSERYYIKRYASDWQRAVSNHDDSFASLHPHFKRLVQLHGLPEEALLSSQPTSCTTALKNRLLSLTISCPETPDIPQITKKLPNTMTVQKLKGLLQRLCRVSASDQHLSYTSSKSGAEFDMPDDLRQLSYYSIQSGDTIILRTHQQ